MTTMESPIDSTTQNDTTETSSVPDRDQVKRDLVHAYEQMIYWTAEVKRLFILSEHPKVNIAAREMARVLNASPYIPWARYTSWQRRRATAAGRTQSRGREA